MALQTETDGLVRLAEEDLDALFALILAGASASEALNDILPALVTQYGAMGATLAADWYDEERERREVAGRFLAEPIEASDRAVSGLIGAALVSATSDEALKTLILGGTQRRIADHVRVTLTSSSVSDPQAGAWIRRGRNECDWCDRLVDTVYRTAGGDFAAHDNCRCYVEPLWD